jgi:hypothetical protein
MPPVGALVAILVAPVVGLSGTSADLSDLTFTAEPPVPVDGSVLDVSIAGHVLAVSGAEQDDSVVVFDLDGDEVAQWAVPNPPGVLAQTNWSPDGSVVAFDQLATEDGSAPAVSTVRTLDVCDGTLSEIVTAEDGAATLDFFPAWSADGALMFLRAGTLSAGTDEAVELVTRQDDGTTRSQAVDVAPEQLAEQDGAVLGGRYVATLRAPNGADVIAIDDDGTTETLMTTVFPQAPARGSSTDGSRLLITPFDSAALELGLLTLLEDGEAPTQSTDVRALDAVFQPDGELVAALQIANPGPDSIAILTLWDPTANVSRYLYDEFAFDPIGIVWTTDDQIVAWSEDQFQVIELHAA